MKQNVKTTIITVLLACNLAATAGLAYEVKGGKPAAGIEGQLEEARKYTIYIGTNDKDTYDQIIPTDEAKNIVNSICAKHVEGYTASDAKGGWVDETGTLTQENTLVYYFYDISEEQITAIMDEVLTELNQNTILLQSETSRYMYYGRNEA